MQQVKEEPLFTLKRGQCQITVLGTAHVSQASADKVEELLATAAFDAVAIELCPSRHHAMMNPDAMADMDMFQVVRDGKAPMIAASLMLGSFQQRMAKELGVEPGQEMRQALKDAAQFDLEVLLIDREVGTTMKRIYGNIPWWQKGTLLSGLLASLVVHEKVSEEEIERLKEGDMLESAFAQFAQEEKQLYAPLIDERDLFMAAKLQQAADSGEHQHILAVVGAGHLKGLQNYLQVSEEEPEQAMQRLSTLPEKKSFWKYVPWLITVLVLTGFAFGFSKSPELGWQLVWDWIWINGSLSALGALIAGAHLLTVITAFCAAPLTSLNPAVGAGMVTAGMETWLRKPSVGDFSSLREDTGSLKGWWHNRVTRILMVFLFSTIGSAIGTYVAGFRIAEQVM
ncbi:MAG: TraB/GumN family protein [Mariprofundaceae bacterium]|nr:TraB/GumN family protein [Mariprofundaceae bacterium]